MQTFSATRTDFLCLNNSVYGEHLKIAKKFTPSLQCSFYPQTASYPWSAVCSPDSLFYADQFAK